LIPLWEDSVPGFDTASPTHCPTLKPYLLPEPGLCAAVIVFPGGGYNIKAPHEADPIAVWLNSVGLSAFVLDYRVSPYRHPYPMLDGLRARRLVRSHAGSLNIRPDQIAILGFSAGGHLASTVSTHWDTGNPQAEDAVDRFSARPNAQILCYPVISFLSHQHAGSMEALLGKMPSEDLRRSLSAEQQVTPETPPTFLFHTRK
jgi:acetyl esterase/lipase